MSLGGFQTEGWRGFLPRRAIVMARHPEPEVLQPALPTHKCSLIGEGNASSELIFLEDESEATPETNELLARMVQAMGLKLETVFIARSTSCTGCLELLTATPSVRMIVSLGELSTQVLLKNSLPLSEVRGQMKKLNSIHVIPTFHPSHLLQNPAAKKDAWTDLKKVVQELGLQVPKPSSSN